jgi:hypothetical protein
MQIFRTVASVTVTLGITAAGLFAGAAPAAATTGTIERSCGNYAMSSTKYAAETRKSASAKCAGWAYVLIVYKSRKDGKWYHTDYRGDPTKARFASNVDTFFSEQKQSWHKGCKDCVSHSLYP